MIEFLVNDMTCGHCVAVITQAIKSVDSSAQVEIDLANKRMRVRALANTQQLETAINNAGYTPIRVGATASARQDSEDYI